MKKLIILIMLGLPFTLLAQTKGFDVRGHFEGLKEGEVVQISKYRDHRPLAWIDSCSVHDGKFNFSETSTELPDIYKICFRVGHIDKDGDYPFKAVITIFPGNGDHIKISGGDIGQFHGAINEQISIEGSPSYKAYFNPDQQKLTGALNDVYSKVGHRLNKIKDSIGYDKILVQELIAEKSAADEKFKQGLYARYNYFEPAIPLILENTFNNISPSHYHAAFLTGLYTKLPDSIKNSYYGKDMGKYAKLAVGQPMPDFTLSTADGRQITLHQFVKANKITIVHIWGTDSYDRVAMQKELINFYRQYHNKGLNIIGVSAETDRDILALANLPWINVSDFKGNVDGSIIHDVYQEGKYYTPNTPNTTNVLLDAQGKIIAWDVYNLELKYYLEKYLDNKN